MPIPESIQTGEERWEDFQAFVQAALRERLQHPTSGWHNGGLASRLPKWLKSAHHRKAILKAIAALRSEVHSPSQ
jgi:hypothetical protein